MINKNIQSINIVPAVFIGKREDGNIMLKCLQGNEMVRRAFQPEMFKHIPNLEYILLGVITGENEFRLRVTDGNDYKDIFEEKWNVLLK